VNIQIHYNDLGCPVKLRHRGCGIIDYRFSVNAASSS
jgi:hypothetical protein